MIRERIVRRTAVDFYTDDLALRLRSGVRRVDAASMWVDYLEALGAES